MESLRSAIRRIDRTSWAISMLSGGLCFVILLFLDRLSGFARSAAIIGVIVLAVVALGAGIHFAILMARVVTTHGHRGGDA
jgi:uncharacterized membrane-anchored protein